MHVEHASSVQEQLLHSKGAMLRGPQLLPRAELVVMPLLFGNGLISQKYVLHFCPRNSPWGIAESLYYIWSDRNELNEDPALPKMSLLQNMYRF
jgi:hypothetical protein